jgi:hypothetical protein
MSQIQQGVTSVDPRRSGQTDSPRQRRRELCGRRRRSGNLFRSCFIVSRGSKGSGLFDSMAHVASPSTPSNRADFDHKHRSAKHENRGPEQGGQKIGRIPLIASATKSIKDACPFDLSSYRTSPETVENAATWFEPPLQGLGQRGLS